MADVDMGLNVYNFNKNIMKQLPTLEDLEKVKDILIKYFQETSAEKYLMMLCRENNDYTLFNFNDKQYNSQFAQDVIECMENRGYGIIDCESTEDKIALELWVKKPGQIEEASVYYIFPADSMVIEY